MVTLQIDGRTITVPEGTTILDAAHGAGIAIPSLCYLKHLNEIGACRVCMVEVRGKQRLITACNNVCEEGMALYTNSPKVRAVRRTNVELLLSQHDTQCASCVRGGNCSLQTLADDLGLIGSPYHHEPEQLPWDAAFPLIRDAGKCVKCMRCVQVCDKIQGLHVWDVANTGSRTTVNVSLNRDIAQANCSLCAQCVTHCPTAALRERDDTAAAFAALADPDKICVVQAAPAVRAGWGESFGLAPEQAGPGRLAAALRRLGFHHVFDTAFSADLTIMEEGSEFLRFLQDKKAHDLPLFTSCCPAWVRFVRAEYPQLLPQLSTAKSPQQMFGAVLKSWYAQALEVDPQRLFCVSVMPCVAKKAECALPQMRAACGLPEVDLSLTTRELCRMLRADHIHPAALPEEEFDLPLGAGTGAGVIFGATGGVMEAALRSAHFLALGKNPAPDAFRQVRAQQGGDRREATFDLGGRQVRTAVVSGLGQARELLDALLAGKAQYDFVEVMACPGGCVGGGGQPIHDGSELAAARARQLYQLDARNPLRFSHENPAVQAAYRAYFGQPLSPRAEALLHTRHEAL